jgi:glycosyltransferase involved in cell wall biosynthesis
MPETLKILFVLENYHPNIGGVETLFKNLNDKLQDKDATTCVLTNRLSNHHPYFERTGTCSIYRFRFFNRYLFTALAFLPVLKLAPGFDLVHTTSYNAALPAFLGAKLSRKKVIVTFHEVWGNLWFALPHMALPAKILHFLFEWFLLRLPFDQFIAVSAFTARKLKENGVPTHKIKLVHNGIDYADFSLGNSVGSGSEMTGSKTSEFTYTYFGRLGISKGLDILLEAATIFSQQVPRSKLKLILPLYPLSFLKKIKTQVQALGLQQHVAFLHELPFDELKSELLASHCVVIPSYSEGFCFAAAECSALGVPIVSSGRGALPEVVSGRFLHLEKLDANSLASALVKASRGDWKHVPLKKFELNRTLEQYLSLYRELTSKKNWKDQTRSESAIPE